MEEPDWKGSVMETMNIALPEVLKDYVQERVQHDGYSSVSEYVRELIRADQKQRAMREVGIRPGAAKAAGRTRCAHPRSTGQATRRTAERAMAAIIGTSIPLRRGLVAYRG